MAKYLASFVWQSAASAPPFVEFAVDIVDLMVAVVADRVVVVVAAVVADRVVVVMVAVDLAVGAGLKQLAGSFHPHSHFWNKYASSSFQKHA